VELRSHYPNELSNGHPEKSSTEQYIYDENLTNRKGHTAVTLLEHAITELTKSGAMDEDPEWCQSIIRAVEGFRSYGHSGGSAAVGIATLQRLLEYKPLSELTNEPREWHPVTWGSKLEVWQSARWSEAFSTDKGRTYYVLSELKPRRWYRPWPRKKMHKSEEVDHGTGILQPASDGLKAVPSPDPEPEAAQADHETG
jgi:hypothetical protein